MVDADGSHWAWPMKVNPWHAGRLWPGRAVSRRLQRSGLPPQAPAHPPAAAASTSAMQKASVREQLRKMWPLTSSSRTLS